MSAAPTLAALFLAHTKGPARQPPLDALEARLQRLHEESAAAWPGVVLPAPLFVQHLAERLPVEGDLEKALAEMNAKDIYLACACLHRLPGAIETLDRSILAAIPRFVARIDSSPAFGDEVLQVVRERLLVAQERAAPRIGDYAGRGSLLSWVRVTASRTALNLRERSAARHESPEQDSMEEQLPAGRDPELDFIKGRYRLQFEAAFRAALVGLPSEQRNILRLHLVDGLNIDRIGVLFGVHRTTVARWIASAREAILDGIRARLREQLRLSPAEFESLVKLVRSQLDVSLTSLMAEGSL